MPEKGERIRFVKGTYAGELGWMDKSRKSKKSKKSKYRYVIVDLDGGEKATRALLTSYRVHCGEVDPNSCEEAALQQHPDLELAMIRLAEMFAECGMCDTREAVRLFGAEMDLAKQHQHKLGRHARFRSVEFTEPTYEEEQ